MSAGVALQAQPAPRAGSRRFDVVGALAMCGVVVFVVLAIAGPWMAPHDPSAGNLIQANLGSDASHLLGYDGLGRDIFSRLLAGARTSFLGPLVVAVVVTVLGTSLALLATWFHTLGLALSGVTSVMFAFPGLLIAALAASVFSPGLTAAVVALSLAYTPHMIRIVRSVAEEQVAKDYVVALRIQGVSALRIALRHVLPNLRTFVLGQASVTLAWATVDMAALSFLGLGVQQPAVDWGVMVAEGKTGVLQGYPTASIAAGLCLVVAVVSFIVVGQRLTRRAEDVVR